MVTPDWSAPQSPQKAKFEDTPRPIDHSQLARPLDRLAAVIIDVCVVLAPIYYLLSSPLRNWMTSSFLMGSEGDFVTTVAGMVGIAVGLLVVYQTFLHYFFRATLGKMLFDLQVVPMFEDERLTCWDCFIRAWFWVAEIICLGLPMLAVFSNNKRRPLHDRVCDTIVVSRVSAGVSSPAVWEQGLVRGFFGLALAGVMLFTLMQVRGVVDKLKTDSSVAALIERDGGACDVVNRNINEEATETSGEHDRLNLAMTLYAAGLADRTCLEAEVEREIASQTPVGAVTYLAQAFIYADDAEVSNSYLDEVCTGAPDSVECHMSQVVSKWSDEDWEAVEESLNGAPPGSGYLEVWGIRHFMKQARYEKALTLLNGLLNQRPLAEFSMVQRVKALFNSYREPEAEAALMQAVTALPESEGRDLSAWVCAQQLQSGCQALEKTACQQVHAGESRTTEIDFEMDNEALARVLALECHNEGQMDYLSFAEAVHNEDWRTFFRANLKRQKEDKKASAHLFSSLILSPEASDLLKIEAARRWAQISDRKQIADLFEQWRDMPSREAWVKTGNILLKRVSELGNQDLAQKIARRLVNTESLSPQSVAVLAGMPPAKEAKGALRQPANNGKNDEAGEEE